MLRISAYPHPIDILYSAMDLSCLKPMFYNLVDTGWNVISQECFDLLFCCY